MTLENLKMCFFTLLYTTLDSSRNSKWSSYRHSTGILVILCSNLYLIHILHNYIHYDKHIMYNKHSIHIKMHNTTIHLFYYKTIPYHTL